MPCPGGCGGRRSQQTAAPVETSGLQYELRRTDGTVTRFPEYREAVDAKEAEDNGGKVFAVRVATTSTP